MALIITAASLNVIKARRALCAALALALAEHRSDATDKSAKGRKAMERVGQTLLKRLATKAKTTPPFVGLDSMLAYVNTAKQAAASQLTEAASVGTFCADCEIAYVRKLLSETVDACEEWQKVWSELKATA